MTEKKSLPVEEQTGNQSAFNMAVASMMRIDTILKDIHRLSVEIGDNNHRAALKSRLMRDLFMQSYALMSADKERDNLKKRVFDFRNSSRDGCVVATREKEDELDELLIDIQKELQKTGILMPKDELEGL